MCICGTLTWEEIDTALLTLCCYPIDLLDLWHHILWSENFITRYLTIPTLITISGAIIVTFFSVVIFFVITYVRNGCQDILALNLFVVYTEEAGFFESFPPSPFLLLSVLSVVCYWFVVSYPSLACLYLSVDMSVDMFFCWLFPGLFGLYHLCLWCQLFVCLSVRHPCWTCPGLSSNFHWLWYCCLSHINQ